MVSGRTSKLGQGRAQSARSVWESEDGGWSMLLRWLLGSVDLLDTGSREVAAS